jgi:protein SCO1/2
MSFVSSIRRYLALVTLALSLAAAAAPAGAAQPRIGGPFALTTPDGTAVTDKTYGGKWLVIYFGYTFCPDACPTALNAIAGALDRLGPLAAKVQPLFITVDPARDTAAVLAQYVKAFDPRIVALSGTREQIAAAARAYRVYYAERQLGDETYAIDHSSFIYVVDPEGRFAKLLAGEVPGHQLAEELKRLMR